MDATGNVIISCSNRVRSVNQSTGIITTVAGTGVAGYSGDGGSATSAELNNNVGVAVDSFGNIYIADRANYRIRFVSKSNGIITTFAGTGTLGHTGDGGRAVDAELYPWAEIAVNQQGSVVFCDSAASRIRAIGGSAVTGVINPKYAIVGVTYAPPGPSSYVQYTNSTYVGSTTTLASSFSSSEALSVSVNAGIKAWGANNGFTVTSTTTATQASNSSSTVTVGIQSTLSDKTTGTPNAFSPVDHDYDIIWLWLNPVLAFTVSPNNPNSLTWNGYAYDTADNDIVDIYPVYVGQLNGHFAIDPSTQAELSRSWATGQTWPSGQGPALNSADYAAILGADPFSNPNYSVTIQQGSNPGTTEDGRFTLSGGVNGVAQSFDYVQSPNNGGALTQQYSNVYTNTSTLSQGSTYTYQEAFGLEQKIGGTLFGISLTNDLKQMQTLTWTNSVNTSITNTTTETDALSITGPSCAGSPCSPAYAGPPEFSVFQDNLYGTFMFNPI